MNRIKELRLEKKISQSELANKFNISQQAISTYENNKKQPPIDLIQRIADYFNVSIDYLLGRTDNRNGYIKPEGNLHKDNIKYKTYKEIEDKIRQKLVDEKIINEDAPIPEDVLDKIIKYGLDATVEILKTR